MDEWNVEISDEVKSRIIKAFMDEGMTDQGMVMIPLTYQESLEYQIQELQVDLMLMRERIMKKYCV